MHLLGLAIIGFVVVYGFADRADTQVSAFDFHAFVIVILGSFGAVLVRSSPSIALRTFAILRELVPGLQRVRGDVADMERERTEVQTLWNDGKRGQALAIAEGSRHEGIKKMVAQIINRASPQANANVFQTLRHQELSTWQPAIDNWVMLAKIGPSFGMVGTITGMIQMFKNMSADNLNIGAAMSLALLATLYGVAFGAGVAGPIGHYLTDLLDERIGVLERCEATSNELTATGRGAVAARAS
ncbi:MAG: MotA/TolQ/ExbB proton channel family protein [Myxococcota bacterium]